MAAWSRRRSGRRSAAGWQPMPIASGPHRAAGRGDAAVEHLSIHDGQGHAGHECPEHERIEVDHDDLHGGRNHSVDDGRKCPQEDEARSRRDGTADGRGRPGEPGEPRNSCVERDRRSASKKPHHPELPARIVVLGQRREQHGPRRADTPSSRASRRAPAGIRPPAPRRRQRRAGRRTAQEWPEEEIPRQHEEDPDAGRSARRDRARHQVDVQTRRTW